MHVPNDAWPTRRGFDRFFGTLTGCGSFYQPGTLTRGEADASDEANAPDFFYTDAIARRRSRFIAEHAAAGADRRSSSTPRSPRRTGRCTRRADIAQYDGVFDAGWDGLRVERMRAAGRRRRAAGRTPT